MFDMGLRIGYPATISTTQTGGDRIVNTPTINDLFTKRMRTRPAPRAACCVLSNKSQYLHHATTLWHHTTAVAKQQSRRNEVCII